MLEFISGAVLGASAVIAKDFFYEKSPRRETLISQINDGEEKIETLLKRNQELEREVEDLLASNKKMHNELSRSKDRIDNLQDKIEDLQSELSKQVVINEQIVQENKELKYSIKSYEVQISKNHD
jgi:peptidoglycan hydrolase CwlO-like protein